MTCFNTPNPSTVAAFSVFVMIAVAGTTAAAQSTARFAAESVISLDLFGGENVSNKPQIIIDIPVGVRVGDNWQLFIRPWLRLPRPTQPNLPTPAWETELYGAGVRYERPGPIGLRVEAGQIVSPVGLGLADALPSINPTILRHLAYAIPMPAFDRTVPRVTPIANAYPLGGVVTLSTDLWDARAAIVNSAPTRNWVVSRPNNPRQTPVFEAGGGVTPMIGLRFGTSFAHGQYATASESTIPAPGGRLMTMVSGEAEYAFRYTKLSGEFVRTSFDTSTENAVAYEWFVQGMQTLSARWFVAARQEGVSAPPLRTATTVGQRTDFQMTEATVGYRLNPEIVLRGSYVLRQSYNSNAWDHQVGASVVWARRWW
jgi:hypothetical protein